MLKQLSSGANPILTILVVVLFIVPVTAVAAMVPPHRDTSFGSGTRIIGYGGNVDVNFGGGGHGGYGGCGRQGGPGRYDRPCTE